MTEGPFKNKQQSNSSGSQSVVGNVSSESIPPVPPQSQSSVGPPPIPGGAVTPPAMPVVPQEVEEPAANEQNLAVTLIQTMVAAAHADGALDRQEEGGVL